MTQALESLIIALPSRVRPSKDTAQALRDNLGPVQATILQCIGKPVDVARNQLAAEILEVAGDSNPYVLWLDDDAWFSEGTVQIILDILRARQDISLVTAHCGPRVPFSTPFGHMRDDDGHSPPRWKVDFELGDLVPIALGSMHFVMHRANLLRAVGPSPFALVKRPPDLARKFKPGEDHEFYRRVRAVGGLCVMASGVVVAHCENDVAFMPWMRPCRIRNNDVEVIPDERTDEEIALAYASVGRRSYGTALDEMVGTAEKVQTARAKLAATQERIA